MNKITPRQTLGLGLLAVSFLLIAAVVYIGYENQTPGDKDLGEIIITWYIPEYGELVESSDLIVIGTVTNKTGVWDTEDGEKPSRLRFYTGGNFSGIHTEYVIRPDDVLKGRTATVIGHVRGGTADGYVWHADPIPSFEVGDRVLLFLSETDSPTGDRIPWYHIGWPNAFTEEGDGFFRNECYGGVDIEQLKELIAVQRAASSNDSDT